MTNAERILLIIESAAARAAAGITITQEQFEDEAKHLDLLLSQKIARETPSTRLA